MNEDIEKLLSITPGELATYLESCETSTFSIDDALLTASYLGYGFLVILNERSGYKYTLEELHNLIFKNHS